VLAIRDFRRLKQEANEVTNNPIQDLKENLLKEERNLVDTIQAKLDLDFDIKVFTIHFHAIEYNSKSNHWIKLKLYQKIPEVVFYFGVNLQMN
jgi:hypothetical protein